MHGHMNVKFVQEAERFHGQFQHDSTRTHLGNDSCSTLLTELFVKLKCGNLSAAC